MKKPLLLLVLLFSVNFSSTLLAANKLDSLETLLKSTISDTQKVSTLNHLSGMLMLKDPARSEDYAKQALSLAEKISDIKGRGLALRQLGTIPLYKGDFEEAKTKLNKAYIVLKEIDDTLNIAHVFNLLATVNVNQGNYREAMKYYEKALKAYQSSKKDSVGIASCFNGKASMHYYLGEYDKAVRSYIDALKVREAMNDSVGMARVYLGIGLIRHVENKFDEAIANYKNAEDIILKTNDYRLQASIYSNYGDAYARKKEFEKAIEYCTKSIAIWEKLGNKHEISLVYNNLGNIHYSQKKTEKAIEYYFKALKLNSEINDREGMSVSYSNIGKLYGEKKNYPLAISNIEQGLELARQINRKDLLRQDYEELSSLYEKTGEYKKALEYHQLFVTIKDSIFNEQSKKSELELIAKYETDKKEQQIVAQKKDIELQNNKLEKQKIQIASFIIGIILLVALAFLLYNRYRLKQKANEQLENINIELEKLSIVARETDNAVTITNELGEFIWANEGFKRMTGFDLEEFKQEKGKSLTEASTNPDITELVKECMDKKHSVHYESIIKSKHKGSIWVQSTLTPVLDNKGALNKIVIIDSDVTEVRQKSHEIQQSINYAKRIQEAVLPSDAILKATCPESFILYKPKDVVSGDFYWFADKVDKLLIAAADCTGHGVPGAFMSMIGSNLLNQIAGITLMTNPDFILTDLHDGIRRALKQHHMDSESKDGMDIALVRIHKEKDFIDFAGAMRPLFIVRNNGEIEEIKGDRQPIGGLQAEGEKVRKFKRHKISINKGDTFYLFSDGYVDQFGGHSGKKFMNKNFKELLLSIREKPMNEQKNILEEAFEKWRGSMEQVDDVLVIGIRK